MEDMDRVSPMLTEEEIAAIIKLIHREVVPAVGCTEPICVALCVAKACELLEEFPERINVGLSANMLKNAMGVGIPGTGMTGLPISIALGALIGRSEYQLEVLKNVTPEDVERGRHYVDEKRISIYHEKDTAEKLYVKVECYGKNHQAMAVIAQSHTNFCMLQRDDKVLMKQETSDKEDEENGDPVLTMKKVYDFATTAPLSAIEFISEAEKMNRAAAELSLKGQYGHALGRIMQSQMEKQIIGDNTFASILSYTSAACDARMSGAMVPVMSNSGSGNQGIACTNPVSVYADACAANHEQRIRALMLSHLTVIYIKQSLGRLSALCGCVVAATGSSCGITYLMGGGYNEICAAVKNMVGNLSGMICDGAKPSCSMKVASGASTAVLSAMLAMQGQCVSSLEGIIDEDVDRTIRNLTRIGVEAMDETDRMVLQIMTSK